MARTQMSLCTLTFIVWGRRERLGKRDKDCPGVTATLGWSHTWQHMQSLSLLRNVGLWWFGMAALGVSRGSGWTQKESRCPRKAEESRPGELRELWGAAPGKVVKGSSLSPNWWEITPWGLPHLGPASPLIQCALGGTGVPVPPGLGVMCWATPCSSSD